MFGRTFWWAYAAHLALSVSYFTMVLFPLFVQHLGGDEVRIGLLAAGALGAGILLRWLSSPLWHRLHWRGLLLTGGGLNLVGSLTLLAVGRLGVWLWVGRLLQGAGGGLLFGVFFAYAAHLVPRERHSHGIGLFGTSGMAGSYLGVWLGEAALARAGFDGLFLAAAATGALMLLLALKLPEVDRGDRNGREAPEGPLGRGRPPGSGPVRAAFWRLCGLAVLFGAGAMSFSVFLAPFAQGRDLRPVWPFFLAYASAAISVRLLAGSLPDRVGLRRMLLPALLLLALAATLVSRVTAPSGLVLVGLLGGVGHGYAFPILGALAARSARGSGSGSRVSLLTSFIDLGGLVGSPLLGVIARGAGYEAMFLLLGVAIALAGGLILAWERWLDRTRARF